jgi:hypothetical protein
METAALLRTQIQTALPRFNLPLTFVPKPDPELLPSGIQEVDRLIGGGFPRGTMTEIAGEASSGRTSLMLSLLAQATARNEYCAIIDAHDTFDPASAAGEGTDLSRLLWIRCGGRLEDSLKAVDRIAHAGGFGLIVYDIADADMFSCRRISLASWFRLRHAVEKTSSALIVITRQFHAKSCSRLQLEMRRTGSVWSGKLLRSVSFEAETRKYQMARSAGFRAQRFVELS